MQITIVGAGAMGGSYGAMLARQGHEVRLVDTNAQHVAAIESAGLLVDGAQGEHRVRVPASTEVVPGWAAMAMLFTDSNATMDAAPRVAEALAPDGFAITLQNGIGNVEALCDQVGTERVLGGSSMCSAAFRAPGHVSLTHLGTTTIGELDGRDSERVRELQAAFAGAGFETRVAEDVLAVIWSKFLLNCSVNALAAITGLRGGEIVRLPEMDALQDRVLDELLAVTEARGIVLPDPAFRASVKQHMRLRFNRPSMLQHVEAGRRTEIDALNAALLRAASEVGVPTPYNEAVVALLKGRELHERQRRIDPGLDHDAWEAAVQAGDDPWPDGWRAPR